MKYAYHNAFIPMLEYYGEKDFDLAITDINREASRLAREKDIAVLWQVAEWMEHGWGIALLVKSLKGNPLEIIPHLLLLTDVAIRQDVHFDLGNIHYIGEVDGGIITYNPKGPEVRVFEVDADQTDLPKASFLEFTSSILSNWKGMGKFLDSAKKEVTPLSPELY